MSEKDGDTAVTRAAFRAYDEHSSVRNRTPWQIWRDACAWCWKAAELCTDSNEGESDER